MTAFLDISAAFDNVQSNILLNILAGIGIPINTLSFTANWCYSRIIISPSFEEKRILYKGPPQGGCSREFPSYNARSLGACSPEKVDCE